MVRGYGMVAVALLVTVFALVGAWSGSAVAQSADYKVISELNADKEDVREVLRTLFRRADVSFSIAPEVQGSVTFQMRNVTFGDALQHILKQVDATYWFRGGIYYVEAKGQGPDSQIRIGGDPAHVDKTPPIITQDDKFLYILRGDTLYKVNKSDLKTVATRKLGG